MAKRAPVKFTIQVDPSVKLSGAAKKQLGAAIGGAAAREIARLDLGANIGFIPKIDWPGWRVVDLANFGKILPG